MKAFILAGCLWLMVIFDAKPALPVLQSLQPGDPMPDVELTLHHYEGGKARVSDFKGKLLIFDFWNIYCHNCIQAMPKMEALQKEFEGRIQIILVTNSTQEEVENLSSRSAILRDVRLPMIVGDTVLTRLFEFRTVPTHVWIDEEGVVNQFTGPYTSPETIGNYLKGLPVALPLKKEFRDFDTQVSLLAEGKGRQQEHLLMYSALFKKITDDGGRYDLMRDSVTGQMVGYKLVNQRLSRLFNVAFSRPDIPFDLRNSRLIIETAYPSLVAPDKTDRLNDIRWQKEHSYAYESRLPVGKRSMIKELMQRDLLLYTGLQVRYEKRRVRCMVVSFGDTSRLENHGRGYQLKDYSVRQFMNFLDNAFSECAYPLVNEVRYSGKIDLTFEKYPSHSGDYEMFKAELRTYGILLREEWRELEMIVIADE